MKSFKLDETILKQIGGGNHVPSEAEIAREIDPMISDYKSMTSGATAEELKEAGLDTGYRGLLLYLDKLCNDGSISITHEAYPLFRDYITRNYDRIS